MAAMETCCRGFFLDAIGKPLFYSVALNLLTIHHIGSL